MAAQRKTVSDSAIPGAAISAAGKMFVTLEAHESDRKLMMKFVSTTDKKSWYHDVDQRASWPFRFTADGKSVVYNVREKGVDNLWLQPLDGSPYRQLTHFTSEKISQFVYSPDGSQLAIERGHTESDAVLLRDNQSSPAELSSPAPQRNTPVAPAPSILPSSLQP